MQIFCTYFDSKFLFQGIALYLSLKENINLFKLYVLCFDDDCFDTLIKLDYSEIIPIKLSDYEAYFPKLLDVKKDRTKLEYYFTSTPFLLRYILEKNPNISFLVYLDADLCFYSSLDSIYNELGDKDIYIIPHRFPKEHVYSGERDAGKFNVGLIVFKNTDNTIKCINRWSEQCFKWCYNRIEDGKLGDQKYLEEWPDLYKNVVISSNIGVGLGGWNAARYKFNNKNKLFFVNKVLLTMLHLNFVEFISDNCLFSTIRINKAIRKYFIYLQQAKKLINVVNPDIKPLINVDFNNWKFIVRNYFGKRIFFFKA